MNGAESSVVGQLFSWCWTHSLQLVFVWDCVGCSCAWNLDVFSVALHVCMNSKSRIRTMFCHQNVSFAQCFPNVSTFLAASSNHRHLETWLHCVRLQIWTCSFVQKQSHWWCCLNHPSLVLSKLFLQFGFASRTWSATRAMTFLSPFHSFSHCPNMSTLFLTCICVCFMMWLQLFVLITSKESIWHVQHNNFSFFCINDCWECNQLQCHWSAKHFCEIHLFKTSDCCHLTMSFPVFHCCFSLLSRKVNPQLQFSAFHSIGLLWLSGLKQSTSCNCFFSVAALCFLFPQFFCVVLQQTFLQMLWLELCLLCSHVEVRVAVTIALTDSQFVVFNIFSVTFEASPLWWKHFSIDVLLTNVASLDQWTFSGCMLRLIASKTDIVTMNHNSVATP